jgi:hypothetical protein
LRLPVGRSRTYSGSAAILTAKDGNYSDRRHNYISSNREGRGSKLAQIVLVSQEIFCSDRRSVPKAGCDVK